MEFYKNDSGIMTLAILDNQHLISVEKYGRGDEVLVVNYKNSDMFPVNFDVLQKIELKSAMKNIFSAIFDAETVYFKTRRA